MTRNLKVLGLLAFAVLAISAMFASAAQAGTKGILTGGLTPETHESVTLTGTQYDTVGKPWNYFEIPLAKSPVTCDNAHFTGTLKNGGTPPHESGVSPTDLTITPVYTECQAGAQAATVTTTGCTYTFTQPETAEDVPAGSYTGKADLVCEAGKAIVVNVYAFGSSTKGTHFGKVCEIKVFPKAGTSQELGGHIVYTPAETEATGRDDITVAATIEGIHATSNCPETPKETDTAIYKNTVTLKALEDEEEPHTEERDLWFSE